MAFRALLALVVTGLVVFLLPGCDGATSSGGGGNGPAETDGEADDQGGGGESLDGDTDDSAGGGDSEDTDGNSEDENDDSDDEAEDQASLDEFFGLGSVHTIEITVDEEGVAELIEEPRSYTHAGLRIDETEYEDVGLRLKGSAGSFIPLEGEEWPISGQGNGAPGKSAFIIDFNRYENGVNHFGLKKLTMNNMVQDASGIHEYLGYALFREGDVPAPRVGYAQVTFNGEEKGVYVLIESPDNDEFVDVWFDAGKGNLYEGVYGTDLWEESISEFDQDRGGDDSKEDLEELVEALDEIGPEDDAITVLEEYFDLDEYLTFAVTELYLGHWDGYSQSANNYMIYHDMDTDLWSFLPWGIDQVFEDEMGPYAGVMRSPGPSWGEMGGRVHSICFTSDACRARLSQAYEDLFARVETLDLRGLADEAIEQIGPSIMAEATTYADPERTEASWDQVRQYVDGRQEAIEAWLPCLTGGVVDNDGDSSDGCTDDCDDGNPGVHPGADETCNFADDDCNGVVDDPAECPKCIEDMGPGDVQYLFCFEQLSWEDARQACLDWGGDLVSIHDPEAAETLPWKFNDLTMQDRAWIGLNDREVEGELAWSDGTAVDLDWRVPYSTDAESETQDCVLQKPYGWDDADCGEAHGYICAPSD